MIVTTLKEGDIVDFNRIDYNGRLTESTVYYEVIGPRVVSECNTFPVKIYNKATGKSDNYGYLYEDLTRYTQLTFYYYPRVKEYKVDQEPLEDEETL